MLLKVGELATRTGLTVRTLHHYDTIALLKPSARSDAGYRLYNQADIARLHAIQALRHLGLPLAEVGEMLERGGEGLGDTIARQIRALGHEITQATELQARLQLLQERLAAGNAPDMADWLSTLALMTTYSKYFSAAEIKRILDNRKAQALKWESLIADVHGAMQQHLAADTRPVQSLALRWMNLTLAMMDDDFNLIDRWGQMYNAEPVGLFKNGPGPEVVSYINAAIALRMEAMLRHMTLAELRTLRTGSEADIAQLCRDAHALHAAQADLNGPAARALVARWEQFMLTLCGNQPELLRKLIAAYTAEPLLHGTTVFDTLTLETIKRGLDVQGHPLATPFIPSSKK
ncbi:MerR family transcriptional regulator [Rhodoferax saidenbachensis]|uniref:DNA-binding transcriptional MerR regulator n=1 Tax=Rhodoferax saidenbachensis TaxID=1484693 RepID=A0ABU1ZSG1_9BURK|nr:MerR family transcriptional regulator [Rhodoferax saidenbachensis]MDR7308473.1 DNA-binding transcriptional MerR regulator [Rhodoferax saidenbachensis]